MPYANGMKPSQVTWPLHTGLLDADGSPKRGFWAFGRIVRMLRSGAPSGGSADLGRRAAQYVRYTSATMGPLLEQALRMARDAAAGTMASV